MDEFDPLSRDVAPPRHEIESDSEDDNEAPLFSAATSVTSAAPVVHLQWLQETATGSPRHLTVLQGESGEAFLRALQLRAGLRESAKVLVDDQQVRSGRHSTMRFWAGS